MNVMLLLAQVAPALTDSIAGANPVLTQVNASDEMNLWSMAVKGGWIMVVLGLMSVLCFYILFERNYVIRKAGKGMKVEEVLQKLEGVKCGNRSTSCPDQLCKALREMKQ